MEDISKRQQQEAEEDRVDYEQVDDHLIQDARNKRKRTRVTTNNDVANDNEEDDDDFRMNLDIADEKFRVKRKKKHIFNDAGIQIEPFKMDERTVERQGEMLLLNEGRKDSDEENDPWFESIRTQQEQMLKEKARKQIDSDESESSDDNKSDGKNDDIDIPETTQKINVDQVIKLKKKLCTFLQSKENAQKALKRLKGNSGAMSGRRIQTKKKNVRKRQKTDEETEVNVTDNADSKEKEFNEIMEITNRLFELKYLDVYQDDKEAIEFEISQSEIAKKREIEREQMLQNGWVYKIEYLDGVTQPKQFGPFS